jgi:hypothetical protein
VLSGQEETGHPDGGYAGLNAWGALGHRYAASYALHKIYRAASKRSSFALSSP